jgi:hypothetical protein
MRVSSDLIQWWPWSPTYRARHKFCNTCFFGHISLIGRTDLYEACSHLATAACCTGGPGLIPALTYNWTYTCQCDRQTYTCQWSQWAKKDQFKLSATTIKWTILKPCHIKTTILTDGSYSSSAWKMCRIGLIAKLNDLKRRLGIKTRYTC